MELFVESAERDRAVMTIIATRAVEVIAVMVKRFIEILLLVDLKLLGYSVATTGCH